MRISTSTSRAVASVIVLALMVAIIGPISNPGAATAVPGDYARSNTVTPGNFWNVNGVLYGYYPAWDNGSSGSYAQVTYHQNEINEDVSIAQLFSGGFSTNFTSTWDTRLNRLETFADNGIIPLYSTGSPNTAHMNALIAGNAAEVAKVQQWATKLRVKDIGPIFLRLGHEGDRLDRAWIPNNPQLYIDWFRAFHDTVITDDPGNGFSGVDNVIWTWTSTEWGFWHDVNNNEVSVNNSRAAAIFPGDAYVDWVGSSGYDRPCEIEGRPPSKWHNITAETVLRHATEWASLNAPTKPFMLAEWGSEYTANGGQPNDRAWFFDTMDDMLGSNLPGFDQIGAIAYFDKEHVQGAGTCDWRLHSSTTAFPQPDQSYNSAANSVITVTNEPDIAAYQQLVDTADLFVPPGPYEAVSIDLEGA